MNEAASKGELPEQIPPRYDLSDMGPYLINNETALSMFEHLGEKMLKMIRDGVALVEAAQAGADKHVQHCLELQREQLLEADDRARGFAEAMDHMFPREDMSWYDATMQHAKELYEWDMAVAAQEASE